MPTYDYVCKSCEHQFERFQSITAEPIRECPKCEKRSVRRVITAGAGVIFKGSGFYQTDYRSKSYQEAAKKEKPEKKSQAETSSRDPSACKPPDVCFPNKN